ncbi:hypothetical protein BU17DRAFT_71925 [Hysterangium stoloniferum]|nr:hypothetical protein BU17DRAFT_71925 [Hysterangium stoloniferum]
MPSLNHKDDDEFFIWDTLKPDNQDTFKLKQAFAKLTDGNVSEYYLSKSMKAIRGLCEKLSNIFDLSDGWPKNSQAALAIPKDHPDRKVLERWLAGGLITALLQVIDLDIPAAAKSARADAILAWYALLQLSMIHNPTLRAHKAPQTLMLIKDVVIRTYYGQVKERN